MQENLGLRSVTDGEFRRRGWSAGFIDAVSGFGLREGAIGFKKNGKEQIASRIENIDDPQIKETAQKVQKSMVQFMEAETDEEKEDTWRKINVSASPNRQKLYLDDLRGESGLYKILGEGKSAIRSSRVDEVSKYKEIPEDDIKNYTEVDSSVFRSSVLSKFIINAES